MAGYQSTYRVQLSAAFGFAAARAVVPYLADLGVSHLYTSPILRARSGSTHGYDVVDPTQVAPELGGEAGTKKRRRHVAPGGDRQHDACQHEALATGCHQ